jgi:hypothetical protein
LSTTIIVHYTTLPITFTGLVALILPACLSSSLHTLIIIFFNTGHLPLPHFSPSYSTLNILLLRHCHFSPTHSSSSSFVLAIVLRHGCRPMLLHPELLILCPVSLLRFFRLTISTHPLANTAGHLGLMVACHVLIVLLLSSLAPGLAGWLLSLMLFHRL